MKLGLNFQSDRYFTVESVIDELKILAKHRQLVCRFLEILEEDGIVEKKDSCWAVVCPP